MSRLGDLTAREMNLDRAGAQSGFGQTLRLLEAVPGAEPIAAIIASMHERLDGSGHPDGLAGERIPIGSRILRAADLFVGLAGARGSAGRTSLVEALDVMRPAVGTGVDAQCFAALDVIVKRGHAFAAGDEA